MPTFEERRAGFRSDCIEFIRAVRLCHPVPSRPTRGIIRSKSKTVRSWSESYFQKIVRALDSTGAITIDRSARKEAYYINKQQEGRLILRPTTWNQLSESGGMRNFLISLAYVSSSPRHRAEAEMVISKVCRDCDPAHLISEFITMIEPPDGAGGCQDENLC